MNALERLIASGNGEEVDRVPVCPGIGHYAAVKTKQPMTKVAFDPQLMAEVVLSSLERHNYDSTGPITDYGLGTESMGSRPVIRDWEQTFVAEFAVETEADIAKLQIPNPLRDGRMPVIIECEQILVERVGSTVGINGGLAGPLSFAANLRGTQQLLYDVIDRPKLVHDLCKIALEAATYFSLAQIIHGGMKTINIYDPVITMLSNSMSDEFGFAYLKPLIEDLKKHAATVLLHICGDTTRMLERMIDVGADILSVDVEVDLDKAKKIINGRASLSGNVATQNLARLSPEDIYKESCQCIKKAASGGRFTLSSSCEVPLETPQENIDAMVRAARQFSPGFLESNNNI